MDHNEVRELLADAAVEPGGLERMMAGDTPNSALVASHLAGCPECTQEMERLRQTVGVIRPAVRAVPPPELRQRTLDYVAAMGRPRGAELAAAVAPGPVPNDLTIAAGRRRVSPRTLVALAAVLVAAVVGTGLAVTLNRDAVVRGQAAEIEALGEVARWTTRVESMPDARRVELASSGGSGTSATLFFSPQSSELVIVADHLAPPVAGREYRCWIEVNGQRKPIGKMFFGGDLAYWVGDVDEVANLTQDARFGVTLIDPASPGTPGEQVLVGEG